MTSTATLLTTWDSALQSARPQGLGPSDVGRCRRSLAYSLHQTPVTDETDHSAAIVGTMIHRGYANAIDETYKRKGRLSEVPVTIQGLSRAGSADDVDFVNLVVTDLKTLDPARFDAWHDQGPPDTVWAQLGLYALGLYEETSQDAWTLRIASLDRRSGRTADYEIPWSLSWASEVRDALVTLEADLLGSDPESAPKDGKGRGSAPCSYCPWMTHCLGVADPEPQPVESLTPEQKEQARQSAMEYLEASAQKSEADNRQKQARASLVGIVGDLGGVTVAWQGGKSKVTPDVETALMILQESGHEVPLKETTTAQRIAVHRV